MGNSFHDGTRLSCLSQELRLVGNDEWHVLFHWFSSSSIFSDLRLRPWTREQRLGLFGGW